MKKWIILLALAAVAGWAAWYYLIREKTPGEALDNAIRQSERSVKKAVDSVTK